MSISITDEQVFIHHKSSNYAKVPYELITDLRLSDGAIRQYAYMHWRYGSNKDNHEGRAGIAESMGVSQTTVTKRIRELAATGWVVVVERRNPETKEQATNCYHVFEVVEDAREFRASYEPEAHEIIQSRPEIKVRKSRKGIGGKPSHKADETQVNTDTPEKLELTYPVNSSSQDLDVLDPDVNTTPAAKVAKPPTPHYLMAKAIMDALGYDEKRLTKNAKTLVFGAAKELVDASFTPEDIPPIHVYVKKRAKAQGWNGFTSMALAKYAPDWLVENPRPDPSAPAAPVAEPSEYEVMMASIREDERRVHAQRERDFAATLNLSA